MGEEIGTFRVGNGPTQNKVVKAKDAAKYAEQYLQEAMDFQISTMRDETVDMKIRLQASQSIINRAAGKEQTRIKVDTTHEEKKTITFEAKSISEQARKELLEAMRNGDVIEAEVTDVEEVKELPYREQD